MQYVQKRKKYIKIIDRNASGGGIVQAGSILFPKWYTIQEKKYQEN